MLPVVHFELPYQDLDRARTFYEQAFGWNIASWPLEDGTSYEGVSTATLGEDRQPEKKGIIGGGLIPRELSEQPVIVIDCDNASEASDKAVEAGATVISKHEYVGVGNIVYIRDTEGNILGLWERVSEHK